MATPRETGAFFFVVGHVRVVTSGSPRVNAPVTRAQFLPLFVAVFLPMFMAAVDQTLLATATPAIAATLGGLRDTSWIVVGYLLASAVIVPVLSRLAIVSLLYATLTQVAYAQVEPARVRACAACHGARGEGGTTGAPRLAGQSQAYLAQQLSAYADGRRQHSVMNAIARDLRPEEIQALAAYYAGLPAPTPPPQIGEPKVARVIKKA
jgi:cytochrome c553